jgi:hypothetical protein
LNCETCETSGTYSHSNGSDHDTKNTKNGGDDEADDDDDDNNNRDDN